MKRLMLLLTLVLLAKGSPAAVNCNLSAGSSFDLYFASELGLTYVPPVGGTLMDWINTGSAVTYTCNSTQIYWVATGNATLTGQTYSEGGHTYPVFETGIPGVGLIIRANSNTAAFPLDNSTKRIDGMNDNTQLGTSISAKLVVTGTVAAGSFPRTLIATTRIENAGAYSYPVTYYLSGLIIKLLPPTCSVSTTSVSVPMGPVPLSSFVGGIGSTSAEVPFNLAVNCGNGGRGEAPFAASASNIADRGPNPAIRGRKTC